MEDILIREMLPEDVPEVLRIEHLSFAMPWSEKSFLNEIYGQRSFTRVAERGGLFVGYICMQHVADECHLLDLAVDPDWRRRGIARLLIDSGLEAMKELGCRFLFLEVRESNAASLGLYEKFGFRTVGTRKAYYINPPEDAVMMVLAL
jgi:ribosomal-protein-alanine N-acetyltransferase